MPDGEFPEEMILRLTRKQVLRYGENSHQSAALYTSAADSRVGIGQARQVQGKELSYNNIQDADAALECIAEFESPAAVIMKHMNPCGAALGQDLKDAYEKALACDPISAFGGIVALNRALDEDLAQELVKIFLEVVIAPSATEGALKMLAAKPNVRVLILESLPDKRSRDIVVKSIAGGFLVQTRDDKVIEDKPKVVTKRAPTPEEYKDLKFAFELAKHVKSNAIVYAKNQASVGIGAGQMSRIYSAKIAAMKAADAKLSLERSVMASDAFFPFPDCVHAAHEAGATAIVQPGGSIKDQESIDAADAYGMAMIFTGVRHFRH